MATLHKTRYGKRMSQMAIADYVDQMAGWSNVAGNETFILHMTYTATDETRESLRLEMSETEARKLIERIGQYLRKCATCGHNEPRHRQYSPQACNAIDCVCEAFKVQQ